MKFSYSSSMSKLQADALIGKIYFTAKEMVEKKKDCDVEFKDNKTGKQLRGYWRLAVLVLPYLKESYGNIKDKYDVSNFVKIECGFYGAIKTKTKEVLLPKSLKTSGREDLMELIEKLLLICEFYKIKDYELKPQERRDFEQYFNEDNA